MKGFLLTGIAVVFLVVLQAEGRFQSLTACPCGGDAQAQQKHEHQGQGGPGTMGPGGMMSMRDICMANYRKKQYKSAGERVFLAGENPSGQHISSNLMMANRMALGCANCHKPGGNGGITFPDGKTSANITWPYLEAKHDGGDPDLIRRAVTEGIASNGEPLSPWMPRWKLSDKEFKELLKYLKTLK
ncbi:MAG: cytochrome c [Armatimonadetes bacterium]|nr:cytochrome c [Armatimonadota bacterium]